MLLRLIVLGQIPGLDWHITFNWVLGFVAVALSLYEIRNLLQRLNQKPKAPIQQQLAV